MRVKEWRCVPCRERARLRSIATLMSVTNRVEVASMDTRRYRLLRGTKQRLEAGAVRTYRPGDLIELSEEEARVMRFSVEPVAAASIKTGPSMTTPADELAERISGMTVADLHELVSRVADGHLEGEVRGASRKAEKVDALMTWINTAPDGRDTIEEAIGVGEE